MPRKQRFKPSRKPKPTVDGVNNETQISRETVDNRDIGDRRETPTPSDRQEIRPDDVETPY
jgi:hypothetical protein